MLSSMVNAGIRDVGVIMQRDYQSLLDHLGSGKDWDLSRSGGGLRLLPPFGMPDSFGVYNGSMEALTSVSSHIERIQQDTIVIAQGDIVANVNLSAAIERHEDSGAEITAVCSRFQPSGAHNRFVPGADGFAGTLLARQRGDGPGIATMEIYIINKATLQDLMAYCAAGNRLHFHRDALMYYLAKGGRVNIYEHGGYAAQITSVSDYFKVSMDMFDPMVREQIFPEEFPIRTKERADVSTYYGESSRSVGSLIADGCFVEGDVENCILFRGVRIERGAKLKNCVIMQDTVVKENANLSYIICDKNVTVSAGAMLAGNERLQLTIPKGAAV